jgi:hypothetical protein
MGLDRREWLRAGTLHIGTVRARTGPHLAAEHSEALERVRKVLTARTRITLSDSA